MAENDKNVYSKSHFMKSMNISLKSSNPGYPNSDNFLIIKNDSS